MLRKARNLRRVALACASLISLVGHSCWAETVIATLPGEFGQLGVAVNSQTNKVYIPLRQSGGIRIVDGNTNQVIQTIPPQPNVVEALDADANPVTNRIWATTCESKLNPRICQRILVIDGTTDGILATITGQEFNTVRFNPATNRVYTTNNSGNNITVLDANTNAVLATVVVGQEPRGIAVNPMTNKIYVTAGGGVLAIVDGITHAVTTLNVGDARNVAVNPTASRVYVTNGPLNTVTVIDAATNAILQTIPVGTSAGGIDVDPAANKVYVANGNSNNVSVINGLTNQVISTVAVGQSPATVRVNPVTHRIYVANFTDGTVSVIQGAPLIKTVLLDIKPGSDPNSININSKGNVPAAILSGGPDNVQASQVDASSVKLAGASPLRSSLEDVNADGQPDLVMHFDTQALQLTASDTSAALIGKLQDGTDIQGSDSVRIIVGGKPAPEPLKMRDVENMSTPDIVGTPGNPANGNPSIQINTFIQHLATLAFLPQPVFSDSATDTEPIQVRLIALSEEGEIILNIAAGSRVNVTFDGGKQVTIFLPAMTVKPVTEISLFPATDGSTYFDEALTQLAQAAK